MDVDLEAIVNLREFEPIARDRMDPAGFDYVAGGAWDEVTLAENEAAWRRRRLRPRVLVDVSMVDPATTLLGSRATMPVVAAPMAITGLAHPEAEVAIARAASSVGVPFTLSTMSSRSIEEVATGSPGGTKWFQLYTQVDPDRSRELCERAAAAGFEAIVLTIDLPRLGYRERDRRSGFEISGLGNFRDSAPAHRPDLDGFDQGAAAGPTPTWGDLATIRGWTGLPLVLKGILTAEDAVLAVEHGADAIVVSNHGARQLDRAPATLDVLEEVVDAVDGGTEVWIDGGVRRGLDVAIALALGAQGVLIGKPLFWALAAGGQTGVERALAIVREEVEIALALLGCPTAADVTRAHVAAGEAR